MKRSPFIAIMVAFFVGVFFCAAGLHAAADQGKEKYTIDKDAKFFPPKKTKPGVEFTHKKHHDAYKIACAECHHVYKDGKNVWKDGDKVQKCEECHKAADEGKVMKVQLALHKNCKDCHVKLKNEGKKTGPTVCAQCHKEKK
jgi:hypothetical protein